ncbi:ribosomal protein L17 [Lipomyces tetrasporus]|uniref:Ribosomal protein L17 n=1 Tax=Lipomyces tetrasporus TaxID=54092 RepID=A0AAD7QS81_9ASCO|nr:ribosomal protein L17 [Lipomyces tetrasporus]KAJ8100454.1 ribosomal protein L17 [Lipomyces tetrasporus]
MPSQGQAHRTLGRASGPRRALLRQLVTSLIEHDSITTTYARAKETQPLIEKLITHAKDGTTSGRKSVYGFVFNPALSMKKLYDDLALRYRGRTGGYTRLLHLEPRDRDAAPMAVLEFVGGPKDLRLYLTAKAIARAEVLGKTKLDMATALNKRNIEEKMQNGKELLGEKIELMKRVYHSGRSSQDALREISDNAKRRADAEAFSKTIAKRK